MNIVSTFDGMSVLQIALDRIGRCVDNYFASEIKPTAIRLTQERYPKTKHIGDVTCVSGVYDELSNQSLICSSLGDHIINGRIDLLAGGSPCKGISGLNQNQEGLEHEESKLFYEFLRLRKELNPKNFFLECTHGNKVATDLITKELGVLPISINSKLVSAQNRPRYYWTDIKNVTKPIDKGLTMDYIYSGENFDPGHRVGLERERWLLSESGQKSVRRKFTRINPYPKSACITANGYDKWNVNYIHSNGIFRNLSISELEWLQTLPSGYCQADWLSYRDAYDLIGDGWTVDIISHILSSLN